MCIWKVAEEDRMCEFCSYYGGCESHDNIVTIEEAVDLYSFVMSSVVKMDIHERARKRPLVYARNIVFYELLRDGYTLMDVSRAMKYNHATVAHGRNQVDMMLKFPSMYAEEMKTWHQFQKLIALCGKNFKNGGCSQ